MGYILSICKVIGKINKEDTVNILASIAGLEHSLSHISTVNSVHPVKENIDSLDMNNSWFSLLLKVDILKII